MKYGSPLKQENDEMALLLGDEKSLSRRVVHTAVTAEKVGILSFAEIRTSIRSLTSDTKKSSEQ
jgi:hypothetical protein